MVDENGWSVEQFVKKDKSVQVDKGDGLEWFYIESDMGFIKLQGQF